MTLLLALFAVGALMELLPYMSGLTWRLRKVSAALAIGMVVLAGGAAVRWSFSLGGALLLLLCLYRAMNSARIIKGRMHERYLQRAALRTSVALIGLQLLVGAAWLAWDVWYVSGHMFWAIAATTQLVVAAVSLLSVLRSIERTAWPARVSHYSDEELPTVSVAIPARNETDDLQECLRSVIASDYPKLEVLAIDDNSQIKRTPEIIRSFAHDGVRFLKSREPDEDWLPKNQAYDRLVREASGEYILFCGVDARFAPDSLRQLISTMLDRRKQMLSVVPERISAAYGSWSPIQAMRYWWELVPPRRLVNRPPVLSTCWVIQRKALIGSGGFKAVARSIVPEAYFARWAAKNGDGYSFLRAGSKQDVMSVKTVARQRNTAVRVRYPQVHRRPEQVAVHSFLEAVSLLLPFVLAVGGFWLPIGWPAHVLAALACFCLIATHLLVVLSTRVNSWWFGLVAPPLMIITDIALLHYSMFKYEFSQVIWRGRNISRPAMHVIPHLPKM